MSFTNTAFTFTRRTCIAASKTILREALAPSEENAPVLWIEQAFAVAAGIILSLDSFHRTSDETELVEHRQLVMETITYLQAFEHSKIATRGVQLLSALKQELDGLSRIESRKRARSVGETSTSSPQKRRTVDIQTLIKDVSQNLGVTSPMTAEDMETPRDMVDSGWDAFNHLLPLHVGFDAPYLFDDFLPNHP